MVGAGASPYAYLRDSILTFPSQKEICMEITMAGFKDVTVYSLSKGIVSVYNAVKEGAI